MTLTILTKGNDSTEVSLVWEKYGCFYARVYEIWGSEWHETRISNPYTDEKKARAAFNRYVKKYLA